MNRNFSFLVVLFTLIGSSVFAQKTRFSNRPFRKPAYEFVKFEDVVKRYFGKEVHRVDPVEGIYSVSCVITRKSRNIFTGKERIKVIGRKDNYARVAIFRDWPGSRRDYLEVSLSYRNSTQYPVVGEFEDLGTGNSFLYNHIEPDNSKLVYSVISESSELLEGEYSKSKGRKTITWKLSYLKIYPRDTGSTPITSLER